MEVKIKNCIKKINRQGKSIFNFFNGHIVKLSNCHIGTFLIVLTLLSFQSCKQSDSKATMPVAKKLPLVKVQQAVKTKLVSFIELTGTVQANIISDVKSPVDGVIESLHARENEPVTKDRIIAVINPNDRLALISSNQMEIQKQQQQIKNAGADKMAVLQQELEKAKSNLDYAKNMYNTVPVVCPMNGIVTYRWLDAGNQVGAKEKIITISDMRSLVVKAEANETYFEAIKQGKKLSVILNAYPNDTLTGIISLVYPQIDPVTRAVKFDIKLQNFRKSLLPGMMASIKIPVSVNENAIAVPTDAVLTNPANERFVFIVDKDSMAFKRIVKPGMSAKKMIEIISGLDENEKVVIMGQEMLKDSLKVKIAKK